MINQKHIDKIRAIVTPLYFSEGKKSYEYLYTIACMDLFYYDRNIGETDIMSGFVDGNGDGGIDFIKTDDNLIFAQGKTSQKLSFNEIRDLFFKMHHTIMNFENGNYDGYSDTLKRVYLNALDTYDSIPNMTLVLFTETPLSDEDIVKCTTELQITELANYQIVIYSSEDIERRSVEPSGEQEYVSSAWINIDKPKNGLEYKYEKGAVVNQGVIVNISANSLKEIYIKHHEGGLFNLNLREHITQKNVDEAIEKSISSSPLDFWFMNNGITIACEDYIESGSRIMLTNFSIINGAQTTTNIGKSGIISRSNDFYLVAKIVKSNDKMSKSLDFLEKISEASNSQKPIRPQDLKANKPEQKKLQNLAEHNHRPLSIRIKRGVKPKNFNKVENWQRVDNIYVGQLILAGIFQKPGTARSTKKTIFENDRLYNMIFKRKMDIDTLYDLVKLGYIYNNSLVKFKKKHATNETEDILDTVTVLSNGQFTIISMICYMIKRKRNIIDNRTNTNLFSDNLSGTLISKYRADDFDVQIDYLFQYLARLIKDVYNSSKIQLKLTSYTNFLKIDKYYSEYILRKLEEDLYDNPFHNTLVHEYTKFLDD